MDPEAALLPGIVDAPLPPRLTAAASTGEPSPSPRSSATPVSAASLRPEPIPLLPAGESLSFHQIDMLDAQRGWGIVGEGDRDQHIVRTEDGGRTWIDVSPPTLVYGGECGDQAVLRAVDAQTAWVGYLHSGAPSEQDLYCSRAPIYDLWKTEDGGKTWRMGSFVQGASGGSSQDGSGFPLLEFVDSQYGWAYRSFFRGAGSSEPQFYQTIDDGLTWRWFPDTYLFRITGIDFLDLKRGWATQSYGFGFYPSFSLGQTHDGGATWEFREIPPPGNPDNFSDCLVKSPSMRTATAGQIIVLCWDVDREVEWFSYDTSDGGQSWRIQPIPDQPDQFVSASAGWRSESAIGEVSEPGVQALDLYWTYDGGRSWSKAGTTSLLPFTDFDFVSAQLGWAVSRSGENSNTLIHPIGPEGVADLELLQSLPAEGITSLGIYLPRNLLLTGHQDGALTLWELSGARYPAVMPLHRDWIYDIAIAQRADTFATASKDGRLRLWEFYLFVESDMLSTQGGEVASVATTDDGSTFASAGQDGLIRIWESSDFVFEAVNPPTRVLTGHTAWVWDLALSADGRTLASASADRTLRLWDAATGQSLAVLTAHDATVGAVAFSPEGDRLASAAWDGSVVVWDTETWQPLWESREHADRVYALHFSPDGSLLASGGSRGELILWNAASGEPLRTLREGPGAVRAVLFMPDGRLLLTGSDDGFLRLWGARP